MTETKAQSVVTREDWASMPEADVLTTLEVQRQQGLSEQQVAVRRDIVGENILPEAKSVSIVSLFIRQFASPLMWVLLVADIAAFAIGEVIDASIILVVLVINGVIAAVQEHRAQVTLESLRKVDEAEVFVRRGGALQKIPVRSLVPGDIVILHPGDRIPADGRVVFSEGLSVTEAALTGESVPVVKFDEHSVPDDAERSELDTMVLRETMVVSGDAEFAVTATGSDTMIGSIADKVQRPETEIPLQRRIRKLTNVVVVSSIVAIIIVFFAGLLFGNEFRHMMLVAISLLVSVIPEGLPVVMTLVLATGVQRMAAHSVLVKRLQAVEALGHTDVLAVDKTGTITRNELAITRVHADGNTYQIGGVGYEKSGDVVLDGETIQVPDHPVLVRAAQFSGLSANATLIRKKEGYDLIGDPTEAAFLVLGEKFGFDKAIQNDKYPMIDELAFDFRRKYYANSHEIDGVRTLIVTGATEALLPNCGWEETAAGLSRITQQRMTDLRETAKKFSEDGLRVLAIAVREDVRVSLDHDEVRDLKLVALVGMQDGLRREVKHSVELAESAGMQVVMITGDHPTTARSIAAQAGICRPGQKVLTGVQVKEMDEKVLAAELPAVCAFARVTPEAKMRIIEAYKAAGKTIAMTGDGVNDGPSLAAAHLGVAMGRTGTEVAKEAADVVLLNDDFAMIPRAAEEGRSIYASIQKVIMFLFSTNLAELMVIVFALFLALPLPLTSAQIVWLNLITDSVLILAIALGKPLQAKLMVGDFTERYKALISRQMLVRMVAMSSVMTAGTLLVYQLVQANSQMQSMTIALSMLVVYQVYRAWSTRGDETKAAPGINWWLVAASGFVLMMQVLATVLPFMQKLLETEALTMGQWGIILLVGLTMPLVDELYVRVLRPLISR